MMFQFCLYKIAIECSRNYECVHKRSHRLTSVHVRLSRNTAAISVFRYDDGFLTRVLNGILAQIYIWDAVVHTTHRCWWLLSLSCKGDFYACTESHHQRPTILLGCAQSFYKHAAARKSTTKRLRCMLGPHHIPALMRMHWKRTCCKVQCLLHKMCDA